MAALAATPSPSTARWLTPSVVPTVTDLYTGSGDDTTFVESTAAGSQLNIHGQAGQDTVDISNFGSLADILGPMSVDNEFAFTDLTADASADLVSHDFTLSSTGLTSTLDRSGTGRYHLHDPRSELADHRHKRLRRPGDEHRLERRQPDPLTDTPGLTLNAGGDSTSGLDTHALNIFGELPSGPFASETHNANDPTVFPRSASTARSSSTTARRRSTAYEPRLHRPSADQRHDPGDRLHLQRLRLSRPVVQCHQHGPIDRRLQTAPVRQHADAARRRSTSRRRTSPTRRHRDFNTPPSIPRRPRQRRDRHGQHPDPLDGLAPSRSTRSPAATIPSRSSAPRPASSPPTTAARATT